MSVYTNGVQIQMNEIALLSLSENNQSGSHPIITLAIQYEVLRQMSKAINDCLEQYDAKLHQLKRDQAKAN